MRLDQLAHPLLLADEVLGGVHANEPAAGDETLVLVADQPLIQTERIARVVGEPEIEPGLVVLERRPPFHDPADGLLEGNVEVERERGAHGEGVHVS